MTLLSWLRGLLALAIPMTTERRQMMCRIYHEGANDR